MPIPLPPESLQHKVNIGDFRQIGQQFLRHFIAAGLQPDDRILDIGCGCGRMAIPLAEGFLGERGTYHGFDASLPHVQWCRDHIRDPRFQFAWADLYNGEYSPDGRGQSSQFVFPYADQSFDFVFAVSVFTHMLPDGHARYLQEAARVLRPGGRGLLTYYVLPQDASRGPLSPEPPCPLIWGHRCGVAHIADDTAPESSVGYTEDVLRRFITEVGFVIEGPVRYGSWAGRPEPVDYQDFVTVRRH